MVFRRGCLICGAQFKAETNDKTLHQVEIHREKCTKQNPYLDDKNAIYYVSEED